MDIKNKFTKKNKLILSILFLSLFACKGKSKEDNFSIDLTVKYNNQTNSFLISNNGNGFALVKEISNPEKFYQFKLDSYESDSIQRVLKKLDFDICDTIKESYNDGTQYVLLLEKDGVKKEIVVGNCNNYQEVNKLVYYIVKKIKEKKKIEVLQSLKKLTPPNLNEIK